MYKTEISTTLSGRGDDRTHGAGEAAALVAGGAVVKGVKSILGIGQEKRLSATGGTGYCSVGSYYGSGSQGPGGASNSRSELTHEQAIQSALYCQPQKKQDDFLAKVEQSKQAHNLRNDTLQHDMDRLAEDLFRTSVLRAKTHESRRFSAQNRQSSFDHTIGARKQKVSDLSSPLRTENYSHAPTMSQELQQLRNNCSDARCMVSLIGSQNAALSLASLQCVDAISLLAAAADANGNAYLAQELTDTAVAVVDAVWDRAVAGSSTSANFFGGILTGCSGVPMRPWEGHERAFALGELVGATLGLTMDGAAIVAGATGLAGSGVMTLESAGLLALPMGAVTQGAAVVVAGGAAAAPMHWQHVQQAGKVLMKSTGPQHSDGPHTLLDQDPASSRFQHEQYLKVVRRTEGRPQFDNPELQEKLGRIWRTTGKVGNGSTADAVRHEILTAGQVAGKSHIKKAKQWVDSLNKFAKNNPDLSLNDRRGLERSIDELLSSLMEAP